RIASELPSDVSAVIRDEAQSLASRSIASAGSEFRCNVDFLARRAVSALQRLKAMLTNEKQAPLAPAFCQVVPEAIDLKADPASWAKATLYGYDLDHLDATNQPLKFFLIGANGSQTEMPADRIGRTTHYQVTLNLGAMARTLHVAGVVKIRASWGGSAE